MAETQNISYIPQTDLCNTCGACKGVCPKSAIEFTETEGGNLFPEIIPEKCVTCGLCYKVCPGKGLSNSLLTQISKLEDPFTGHALKTYLGRATDTQIYSNSQSGGVASALLISLFERGDIKGAIVVTMDSGLPPRPVIRLASTMDEIKSAQKSKYNPVPLLTIIEKLRKIDYPVAIIGLPCHIHGLYNIFESIPGLKKIVKYRIGLICAGTMRYTAMDYLISKTKKTVEKQWQLIFRDKASGGYPGNVKIVNDGVIHVLHNNERKAIQDYFTLTRCRLCFDKMNIFSDITLGDPWGIDYADHKNGETVCIVRNEKGLDVVENAIKDSRVKLKEITYEEVVAGQMIDRKKEEWKGYLQEWLKREVLVPNYYNYLNPQIKKSGKKNYEKILKFSLSVDNFQSKQMLIEHVNMQVKKKIIIQKFMLPYRAVRKIARFLFKQNKIKASPNHE
jgi:coenzyme F420 hydrogenase subunit beta